MRWKIVCCFLVVILFVCCSFSVFGAFGGGGDECGDGEITGDEDCDPAASPSGCNSGYDCSADTCKCNIDYTCNNNGNCGWNENEDSCPGDCSDDDSDDVPNGVDDCPNTPWAERNQVNDEGCSCSQFTCPMQTNCDDDTSCKVYYSVRQTCSVGVCNPNTECGLTILTYPNPDNSGCVGDDYVTYSCALNGDVLTETSTDDSRCLQCTGATPDLCGTTCTNLDSDSENCGTCNYDCYDNFGDGFTCIGGVCVPDCENDPGCSLITDKGCVDVDTAFTCGDVDSDICHDRIVEECTGDTPICDPVQGTCVQCISDTECQDAYGCQYECRQSTNECFDNTDHMCGPPHSECRWDQGTCSCSSCEDTEICAPILDAYYCQENCNPETCTAGCFEGVCQEDCSDDNDCEDGNSCTIDTCTAGDCFYEDNTGNCMLPGGGTGQCVSGGCEPLPCNGGTVCSGTYPRCDPDGIHILDCDNGCESIDTCPSGLCGGNACTPECTETCEDIDVSEVTCGLPTSVCNGAEDCGTGTKCDIGQWCDIDVCENNSVEISSDPGGTVTITEGSLLTVSYTLYEDDDDARLRTKRWPYTDTTFVRTFTYQTKRTDVGVRSLIVEAFIPAEIFGQERELGDNEDTPLTVRVRCNPSNKCCDQRDFLYKNDNTACDYDNDGDTNDGICQGSCVENCIENYYTDCSQNNVYYFDSCDNRGDISQECSEEERCSIEGGSATCVLINKPCTGTEFYRCQNNEAQFVDECGSITVLDTCTSFERCEADEDSAECKPKGLCSDQPGTRECDNTCVDWLTNPNHCGGCGRTCNSNELCDEGSCVVVEMCERVCGPTQPCDEGQVCINPDDCFHSECQAINVLEQTPSAVEDLSELLQEGLIQVNTSISGNDFRYRITNLAGTELNNISIETEFKKLIAASANDLYVKGVDYDIIEDDPVLAFKIPVLKKTTEFTVSTPRQLTEDDLSLATILGVTYTDILDLWNNTKDALTIGLNSEFDGEKTKFHLSLNPNKGLNGVSVPLSIPKCMAQYASEMQLAGNFEIIQEDPLIVWQFDELNKPAEITFSVAGDIDEECKAQLKAMALANRIGKPINPWFAILIIPVIGILLIFFQRFSPEGTEHEKLSKKEFFSLARSQNQSEDEIERAWHDYKRRF